MISKPARAEKHEPPREAYVWIWLPGEVKPVVAGRIELEGKRYLFNYGRSYLERGNAIPIYLPELPLKAGVIAPEPPLTMAGCLRDGSPDAWGQRVIINRLTGMKGEDARQIEFDDLTYLLQSGSDRAGALDFQVSGTKYAAREQENASLAELVEAAELVERGVPLTEALSKALYHGSSIGGARPKALIQDGDVKYIAKFSAANDTYAVVKAEFIAMRLAAAVGLHVAPVRLTRANNKDVLLVQRFDRVRRGNGWERKAMVSALTMFGLHELQGHYGSYSVLADIIRARFTDPDPTLRELFGRLVFNVLCGNTDDHARNHAGFWDGAILTLTPAYDICPQARGAHEANQSLFIAGNDRTSRLVTCLAAAPKFLMSEQEARAVIDHQMATITELWAAVCDEAELSQADRNLLWGRQFLSPYAQEGYAS